MKGAAHAMSAPTLSASKSIFSRAGALLWLVTMLGGCVSIPKVNLYTLSAVAVPGSVETTNSSSGFAVTVDAASVLDLVDRPQFVVGIGESRVAILEQQRWAEPLRTQIARTIAMNLARLLGNPRVSTNQLAGTGDADYRVTVDVQRFETRPGEAVTIEVLWTARRGASDQAKSGRSTALEKIGHEIQVGHGKYDALVAAHNRALATISRDIVAAIQK